MAAVGLAVCGEEIAVTELAEEDDFDRAIAAGGQVYKGAMGRMQDQFWGDRSGTFTDPHGYVWTIATRKEDLTPQELKQRQDEFMKNFAPQPVHS